VDGENPILKKEKFIDGLVEIALQKERSRTLYTFVPCMHEIDSEIDFKLLVKRND